MCQFGELVAAHDEAEPVAAIAGPCVLPFVDKRVIGPATGPDYFRGFGQLVRRKVDLPIALSHRLGKGLCRFDVHCCAGFLLRQLDGKSVWLALRSESNASFVCIAFLEMPDRPDVGEVQAFPEDFRQFLLSSTFQFDEVLNLRVSAKRNSLLEARRGPCASLSQVSGRTESCVAIHAYID